MKVSIFIISLIGLVITSFHTQAVSISDEYQGQVLIYPYYTANNNLNTIYSVINLSAEPKAVKVRFLEGDNGLEVLNFNVYLDKHDVWNGALGATTSTYAGHVGEPSVNHLSADQSCAPYLNKSGQEFLPFRIDTNPNNNSMSRATEGHIEIIELGVINDSQMNTAAAISHGSVGVPANCDQLADAWDTNGYWENDPTIDLTAPTGGLMGTAAVIDVANGSSYDYKATALNDFWADAGTHTEPGNLLPNLASGSTESKILVNNELQTANWLNGFEAVSAVLMQSTLINEYSIDEDVLGATEWVVTFPTKNFHVNVTGFSAVPPFNTLWNDFNACEEFRFKYFDRESVRSSQGGVGPLPPQGANPSLCTQANVIQFLEANQPQSFPSKILGSDNLINIQDSETEFSTTSGWVELDLINNFNGMTPMTGSGYLGLPAVGFQVQKFSGAGLEDLSTDYGSLNKHKSTLVNQ